MAPSHWSEGSESLCDHCHQPLGKRLGHPGCSTPEQVVWDQSPRGAKDVNLSSVGGSCVAPASQIAPLKSLPAPLLRLLAEHHPWPLPFFLLLPVIRHVTKRDAA